MNTVMHAVIYAQMNDDLHVFSNPGTEVLFAYFTVAVTR